MAKEEGRLADMMKMKEVCNATGLSERAVRLYVKEQLLEPQIVETPHRNEYYFTEDDIAVLKNIAVLRNAGFGIADIKHMQNHEEDIPALIDERKKMLEEEIFKHEAVKEALERLTIGEQTNAKKLADALEPTIKHHEKENAKNKNAVRVIYIIGFLFFAVVFTIPVVHKFGMWVLPVLVAVFSLVLAGISMVMAIRYLTTEKRAQKLIEKGNGRILSVVEERGFDISFARAGTGPRAAGKWGGNGGLWQLVWIFWNEIRLDCWYPIIQYVNSKGEKQLASFPYGWMKNSFKEGQQLSIAWDGDNPEIVFPMEDSCFLQKGWVYLILGVILLFVFVACMIHLYNIFCS